jgi:dienelactone hydrolase
MMPFFFGASDRRLFGVYDAPTGGTSTQGVLICNPVGEEYFNAHRAYRTLARQLAGAGVHALRFDYLGTGDSAGELDQVHVDDWVEDIERALNELREMADVKTVGLVGLRVGAALAAAVARKNSEVDRIALWDPIANPEEYLARLDPTTFPRGFVTDLGRIMAGAETGLASNTLLLCTGSDAESHRQRATRLEATCTDFVFVHHDEYGAWETGDGDFGSLPTPVLSLQTITEWISVGR